MTSQPSPTPATPRQALAWTTTLDVAAIAGSLLLACMMPFVGLAAVAALTLPWRAGVLTVLVAWGVNQAIGYGLLGFPTDTFTILRGVAILACTLLAFGVARFGRAAGGRLVVSRAVLAFVAAFAVYEAAMYAFAVPLGGVETFTPAIIRMIGVNDALWFAGLMALHLVATSIAPARFGGRPAVALA